MLETKSAAAELKIKLQKAVEALVQETDDDDDDYNLDATDNAIQCLFALKQLNFKNPHQDFVHGFDGIIPVEFKCPISGILMNDPVVLASGQTYEKQCIQKWLKDGHLKCPQTDQLLSHTILTPNHSIKRMIFKWCKLHNIEIPMGFLSNEEEECMVNANHEYLIVLLEKLSVSSLSDAKEAAKELRTLTNRIPSFRALFGDFLDSICEQFHRILLERASLDEGLREDLAAIVLNISIHETNKMKLLEVIPSAISFLIKSLEDERIETRRHAAAVMCELSKINANKLIMGKSGAIRPLIDLIAEGHELTLKDAASALKNLCTLVENRERAVSQGAVMVAISKIIDCVLIDEMLEILGTFSSHQMAMDEMEEYGGIYLLFSILREKSTSEQNKEICVAILYTMCFNDRRKLRHLCEVENAYEILSQVVKNGTSRAKRKANGILERLNRFAFASHTA